MTFQKHIAETSRFRAASSLSGQSGLAAREERRFTVSQRLHQVVPAAALPGDNQPRRYLAGDPWQDSGP